MTAVLNKLQSYATHIQFHRLQEWKTLLLFMTDMESRSDIYEVIQQIICNTERQTEFQQNPHCFTEQ